MFIVIGCNNNQQPIKTEVAKKNIQNVDSKQIDVKYINVLATFEPTMELTEKIKKATLEELIIERYKRYEEEVGDGEVLTQEALRIWRPDVAKIRAFGGNREVKKVPVNSNLAKVYFLQNFISFYVDNEDHYSAIFEKELEKKRKQRMLRERNNGTNISNISFHSFL